MPPKVALLIGAVFVIYALRTDRRRAPVVAGLFWPTLWYMVVSSRPVGVWFVTWGVPVPGGGSETGGSTIDASFFLMLTIIGFVILSRRHFEWGRAFRENPWMAALLLLMAASILWSNYSFISFKRYLKILGAVSMALVVLTNPPPLESICTVLRRCLYVHLPMSIICTRYFRNIGVSFDWSGSAEAWQGISTSKNTLGQIAMLGAVYFFWEVRRNWKTDKWKNLHVVYLAMAVFLLKGSENAMSMTSVSVCVFAIGIFTRIQALRDNLQKARTFVRTVFFATVSLISLILAHSVFSFTEESFFGTIITKFGRDITLTDRTHIWDGIFDAVSERGNPLMGVGFGGFWIGRDANIGWNSTMTWVLGQGHNGYIDTYLQLGLIGAFLLAGLLLTRLPRLLDSLWTDFDFGCFRIALFITIMFVNITETTMLRGDHHLWFILQLVLWTVPTMWTAPPEPSPAAEPVEPEGAADSRPGFADEPGGPAPA